jgi:hypothetical protein
MLKSSVVRVLEFISITAVLVAVSACGGGTNSTSQQLTPPVIAVSITSHPAGVNAGLSYTFTAAVTNTTSTAVTWKISCASVGCSADAIGAIAANGTYSAPASAAQAAGVSVTATSVADSSKSDSWTFQLMPPIQVALAPAPSQVTLGFKRQFNASVDNDLDNRGVQWSVGGVRGGNASQGTITSDGVYSAPAGSSEMITAITAASVTDPSKSASVRITLVRNEHPNFSGTYTFSFSGPDGQTMTAAGGTLHLDGSGGLTATLDINSGLSNNVLLPGVPLTGFYGLEHDNLGHAALTYTLGQQSATMSFRFALVNDNSAQVMEFDGTGAGIGRIEKQTASGLNTALDGDRVFALSGLNTTGQYNPQAVILGTFTGIGESLSGGMFDAVGHDQEQLTGSYSFGSTNTLTVTLGTWNSGMPVTFRVHPVSPDKAFVMSTGMPVLAGVVEKQTGRIYSPASFAGTWVFSLQMMNSSYRVAQVRLVRITSDGSGSNATGDMFDNNSYLAPDGPAYPVTFATYHVADNGRGNTNAQFAMPEPIVWYWVTPQRGYIKSDYGVGEFFLQQDAPFSIGSLQAAVSVVLHGYSDCYLSANADDHLGVGRPDGSGGFTLVTSDLDGQDMSNPIKMDVTRTGTYTIGSDGRGTISLDNGSFWLRFLAVAHDKLLLMRPGYDVIGTGAAEQPSFATN